MPQAKLLVVEDDDGVRSLVADYLKEHSHIDVDTARDGAEALHHISMQDYSVVVLDLVMPHMSGIDFLVSLQILASDPALKTIQQPPAVIVITSTPQDDLPAQEIEHRFPSLVREVMRKPLDVCALGKRVDALL